MDILESLSIVTSIVHVSRKSGELATTSAPKAARAIRMACAHWLKEERGFVTPELHGVAPWHSFEMKIYRLGKALPLVMKKFDLWKGESEVLDACVAVMKKRELGRGRQTFVLTLGEHGGAIYGEALAGALRDDEIAGYAMRALYDGHHTGYANEVRIAAAKSDVVWVQNAAKRYLDREADAPAASTVTPKVSSNLSTAPARGPDRSRKTA